MIQQIYGIPTESIVQLRVPQRSLFVGSYHRIPVTIPPGLGLEFDVLRFEIPAGPRAGLVSPSRDSLFNPKKPHVMLLVGFRPGVHRILAVHSPTKAVLGAAIFKVNAQWANEDAGPTAWFTGTARSHRSGTGWLSTQDEPQNMDAVPARGTRRIAILLVDTSSERFTTDEVELQRHRNRWLNEIINGVTEGGVTRSSRAFFREVSYGNLDLSAQVFGPVQLPGSWDDYFNWAVPPTGSNGSPKGTFYQACVTAADNIINYNEFDTLLCVSKSMTYPPEIDRTKRKRAWPYASVGNRMNLLTSRQGSLSIGTISMPNEWGTDSSQPERKIHSTFSHELAHNLGLLDQYRPDVPERLLFEWDMMHRSTAFPHFSLAHRMMLGWVKRDWIQTFNIQSALAPVDRTVTLHPIELGEPSDRRKSGVEIRLADGWNYYFEYRVAQANQIGDRNLPRNNRVLGTDVVSGAYEPPMQRPNILRTHNANGDGAVLDNGQGYEERFWTDPANPSEFRLDVSGIDGESATVRVTYGTNRRPDPSIRPWPAGPGRRWQSPDIEVRNAKSEANAAWFNVPWSRNANTVIAKVKNSGGLDAPAVRVDFYVKNFNIGGAPETFLGSDRKDIPRGATVEFTTTWVPPNTGHYCIVVRIPLYQRPTNPTVVEMTELNNHAQSNYMRFISHTSSPPSREVTFVEVGNPYPVRTRIWITAGQDNPLYRTYLERSWLYLDPGETKKIRVMFEYAPDNLTNDVYPSFMRNKHLVSARVPNN